VPRDRDRGRGLRLTAPPFFVTALRAPFFSESPGSHPMGEWCACACLPRRARSTTTVKPSLEPNSPPPTALSGPVRAAAAASRALPHRTPSVLPTLTEDVLVKYAPGAKLGHGAYGTVLACTERTSGRRLACKVVDVHRLLATEDGPNVVGRLRNEINVMSFLAGHPHIVRLVDVLEATSGVLFIVQELCEDGTVGSLVGHRLPTGEARAARLLRGIVKAVLHCHQRGVIHRDIKLDNFMLSGGHVKLGDFGFARFVKRGERLTEAVGSPFFMAPEMLDRARGYGFEADTWSVGVCLHRMLSGDYPFDGPTTGDVFAALRNHEVTFRAATWGIVSDEAKDMVRRLLTKDPRARLRLEDALAHPWMARHRTTTTSTPSQSHPATTSARVFLPATDAAARAREQAFLDCFASGVEHAYATLLAAPDADAAASAWGAVCIGLRTLEVVMMAWPEAGPSPYVLGGEGPSLAEATAAPTLYRMNATLPAVRGLDLLRACASLGLTRTARWITHVLANAGACCDVAELPSDVYIALARRLSVTYDGPPSSVDDSAAGSSTR